MAESKKKVDNVFETLSAINVNEYVEKKGNFNYVSWANIVSVVKKKYPGMTWGVEEYEKSYKKENVVITE